MADKIATILHRSTLMQGVPEFVINQIASEGRIQQIKGRYGRLEAEELGRRIYLVLFGEMRMFRLAPDGQEYLVERYGPGEFFCLAALITRRPCQNYLTNHGAVTLAHWGQESFQTFMATSSELHQNILQQMAHCLETERELRNLSRCNRAEIKVAGYLLYRFQGLSPNQIGHQAVDLRPISLTAQELGLARETFSRCLHRLAKQGGIRYNSGRVQIHDLNRLHQILEDNRCHCQLD